MAQSWNNDVAEAARRNKVETNFDVTWTINKGKGGGVIRHSSNSRHLYPCSGKRAICI